MSDAVLSTGRHQVLADRLRAAADWLERHPEFNAYSVVARGASTRIVNYSVNDADGLAAKARVVGGRWDKDQDERFFRLRQEVAEGVTVEIVAYREDVCERIVVGQREVEVTGPDPELVAALPKVTRTKVIEDVEWRCAPLLGREGK